MVIEHTVNLVNTPRVGKYVTKENPYLQKDKDKDNLDEGILNLNLDQVDMFSTLSSSFLKSNGAQSPATVTGMHHPSLKNRRQGFVHNHQSRQQSPLVRLDVNRSNSVK